LRLLKDLNVKGERYLDLGCGSGGFTVQMAREVEACELYGVDIAADAVRRASERGIQARCLDLSRDSLPFSEGSFDLITAIEVIEHLTDTDKFLLEVHRCLRNEGYFVVTTPNLVSWSNRAMLLLGFEPGMYEVSFKYRVGKPFDNKKPIESSRVLGHFRLYTYKGIKDHLEVSGFDTVTSRGASVSMPNRFLRFVDRLMSAFPSLSSELLILATKS
jgi:SAM-dependent methyltransferase